MISKKKCGACAWIRKGYCRKPGHDLEDVWVTIKGDACEKFTPCKK